MTHQRTWVVTDPRREDALETAKQRARSEGYRVRTLVRMDIVAGGWRVTLAVEPGA